eukprot:5599661-Prymnesium_polylepis.2
MAAAPSLATPSMAAAFLTGDRVLRKFYERFLLGRKSKYIDDDGNVIRVPGQEYLENGVKVQY